MKAPDSSTVGELACEALRDELAIWPKPGLVSEVDPGSHADMDAGTFRASIDALGPFFTALTRAGARNAEMAELRHIGRTAEEAMLSATGGINTHRGAIFGLGLLCAAAGALNAQGEDPVRHGRLGEFVRQRWGRRILCGPIPGQSHGAQALRQHGAGGARAQAATGFPAVYSVGLPAWREAWRLTGNANAAGVQVCFSLIAALEDTNLLHRGGISGLRFCRRTAQDFLDAGGVSHPDWRSRAAAVHRAFVTRGLSPGGSADLLAMTLLVGAIEIPPSPSVPFSSLPVPFHSPLPCCRSS